MEDILWSNETYHQFHGIYIMGLNGVYMLPASNQTMGKSLNYMQVYSCYPKLKKQGKMLLPLEDGA